MTEAVSITAVMRALADPTRRAVFEQIVNADEITVVELTRASSVTQGAVSQHLKALKRGGASSLSAPKAGRSITAPSRKAWSHLWTG